MSLRTIELVGVIWSVLCFFVHSSTLNYVSGNRFQLSLRNAVQTDLMQVATLCAEVFEGPFDWYQFMDRRNAVKGYYDQLNDRYRLVTEGYQHAMIVACEKTNENEEVIRGFIEVGTLPSPILETQEIHGNVQQVRPERPYFGNVAVDTAVRRQGVGAKLVKIGLKLIENKWKDDCVFVAVDSNNDAARSMYEKLGFKVAVDETMMINRRRGPPRVFYISEWGDRVATATDKSCDDGMNIRTAEER